MVGLQTGDETRQTARRLRTAGMKWWGWGDEGVSFTHTDKPALAPCIPLHLGLDVEAETSRPVALDELRIPDSSLEPSLRSALESAVGSERVSTDPLDRVVHARGKCLRDLVRHRRGGLGRVPPRVGCPGDEG